MRLVLQVGRRRLAAVLVLAGVGLVLLLLPQRTPTYSCERPPVVDLVSPQPDDEDGHDFFDQTKACADAARGRLVMTGVIAALALAVVVRRAPPRVVPTSVDG